MKARKWSRYRAHAPNDEQRNELGELFAHHFIINPTPEEIQEHKDLMRDTWIAYWPNYQTDSPGYVGDVFAIIWPGGPEMFDVVTRDHKTNKLEIETKAGWDLRKVIE